jgi:hypothetical protein
MVEVFADGIIEELTADPSINGDMPQDVQDDHGADNGRSGLPLAEEGGEDPAVPRPTFIQYLTSPVVTLVVGRGEAGALLTAHQSLLTQSPFFAEACAEFTDTVSVSRNPSIPSPGLEAPSSPLSKSLKRLIYHADRSLLTFIF